MSNIWREGQEERGLARSLVMPGHLPKPPRLMDRSDLEHLWQRVLEARPLTLSWNLNWVLSSKSHMLVKGLVLIGSSRPAISFQVSPSGQSSCEEQRVLMAGVCKPRSIEWLPKLEDPGDLLGS